MAVWSKEQQSVIQFKVTKVVKCYSSAAIVSPAHMTRIGPACQISKGTIDVKYNSEYDAMEITKCDNPIAAKGKFIKYPDGLEAISYSKPVKFRTTSTNEKTTDTSTTSSLSEVKPLEIDEEFTKETSKILSADEYRSNLKNGLRVKDLRGVLGMPHQFLPTADPRIDGRRDAGDIDAFGRVYSEKIIKNIPLLLMTPGVPKFMSAFDKNVKKNVLGNFLSAYQKTTINDLLDGKNGKFYSLKFAYVEYYYYVNAMLRAAAIFLGIGNEKIDGVPLGTNNWSNDTSEGNALYDDSFATFLKPYYGCVAFYADAGTSVDDSFSNSTTESSMVSGTLNSLSDKAREVNFLVGSVGSQVGLSYDTIEGLTGAGDAFQNIGDEVDKMLGKTGFLSNVLSKGSTILAGGRLVFPEIWSDSSFSRSYSCSMKLISPSGDPLSVYWNILVPIYHLLGFCMPREATDQAYFSPFLVRAYYKGLFNVDMGIIPGLSVTKGDEGEWTVDGIPTVANVSFEIKDLYEGMYMSKVSKETGAINDKTQGILSNVQELDYIANSCGININDQEVARMIKLVATLKVQDIADKVTLGIFGNISQFFNQKMNNIFGVFK